VHDININYHERYDGSAIPYALLFLRGRMTENLPDAGGIDAGAKASLLEKETAGNGVRPKTAKGCDFRRLSGTELARATGILREHIARWVAKHGLPRNVDGTYSLPDFIHWLRFAHGGRGRRYRQKPSMIGRRLALRINTIIERELSNMQGYHDAHERTEEMAGNTCERAIMDGGGSGRTQ
jgi:hypothetical protein